MKYFTANVYSLIISYRNNFELSASPSRWPSEVAVRGGPRWWTDPWLVISLFKNIDATLNQLNTGYLNCMTRFNFDINIVTEKISSVGLDPFVEPGRYEPGPFRDRSTRYGV